MRRYINLLDSYDDVGKRLVTCLCPQFSGPRNLNGGHRALHLFHLLRISASSLLLWRPIVCHETGLYVAFSPLSVSFAHLPPGVFLTYLHWGWLGLSVNHLMWIILICCTSCYNSLAETFIFSCNFTLFRWKSSGYRCTWIVERAQEFCGYISI